MWGGMAERCRRDAAQGQPPPSLRHTSCLMPTHQVGLEAGATFHRSLA